MKNAMLLVLVSLVLASGAAHAQAPFGLSVQPVPDRKPDRELLLERLVDAQTTFHSWNIAGAKARLSRLVADLAHDTTPFNQAVKKRASEIVSAIDASHLRDADNKLAALIKAVRDGVMPAFADLGDTAVM